MDYPHEGAALARRLTVLAILTLGGIAVAIGLIWLLLGVVLDEDGDDGTEADGATAASTTSTASTTTSTTATSTTTTTTTTTTTLPVGERVLSSLLGELSLERKVSQLLVVGGPGTDLLGVIESAVGTPCVGGVFVADREANWVPSADPTAATAAITAMAEQAAGCAIRPLIVTDAEPGEVLRVPVEPLASPGRWEADFAADPDAATSALREGALRFAQAILDLGVHVNLGVVADVDVDGDHYMARRGRTFGDDPAVVDVLAGTVLQAHCDAGLAAAVKHFPNQGATLVDPHLADSFASTTPEQWEERGRVPYRNTAAPLVMTGHVRFAGVDGELPASLSSEITTGWLRDGLGYGGVVITDDLQAMRGVTGVDASAAGRAEAAIDAGADLLLFVSPAEIEEVVARLVARGTDDRDFVARIDESVARVLRLKAEFDLVDGLDPTHFGTCLDP